LIRILFICSRNRLRSPTAAQVFSSRPDIETDSAGLAPDADHRLEPEQLEWADLIVVMERAHQRRLAKDFSRHLKGKRVVCLNIPDDYTFMDPALVSRLEAAMAPHLRSS
jgi:predicted protein tyrosine phosphatase